MPSEVTDAAVHDHGADNFAAGTTDDGAYVARTIAGEVTLAPKIAGEFTGDRLPKGWSVVPSVDGGTGTLDDGMLSLDGASLRCTPVLLSPRSLEFSAVFAARPDQHAGLGINFVDVPWVMFSTKWGRRLYGRTHLLTIEDRKFPDDLFDAPHTFRIDWNILDIVFSVDGHRLAHLMVPMPGHMRAMATNERLGTQPLRVEWMRLSPYAPEGRFTSRVLDAGATAEWHDAVWAADVPEKTSLGLGVRTGDSPRPDRSWSRWRALGPSGAMVAATSRYLQYRALLATTDASWTPALRGFRVRYSATTGGSGSSSLVSGRALGCQ